VDEPPTSTAPEPPADLALGLGDSLESSQTQLLDTGDSRDTFLAELQRTIIVESSMEPEPEANPHHAGAELAAAPSSSASSSRGSVNPGILGAPWRDRHVPKPPPGPPPAHRLAEISQGEGSESSVGPMPAPKKRPAPY
jgi:hypothetical protein